MQFSIFNSILNAASGGVLNPSFAIKRPRHKLLEITQYIDLYIPKAVALTIWIMAH
jgi:hypothetical protein